MKIKFEPRDIWIGLYWTKGARITSLETDRQYYTIYVCLIPFFPIVFSIHRNISNKNKHKDW